MRPIHRATRGGRSPARGGRIPLATAVLAVATATAAAQSRTYTTDADFDLGTLVSVNHDAPNHDQLQLDVDDVPFPFVCVPASGRGTIIRINALTGAIVGEYRSAPEGNATNPSRTSIDSLGNCWAANRARDALGIQGSAVKLGVVIGGTRTNSSGTPDPTGAYLAPPFDYNTCIDRNGDGLIHTSRGLGDVLDWDDMADGGNGGPAFVTDADDECILLYQRTPACPNIRHVSLDANDDVWVGSYPNFMPNCFQKLNGTNGAILQTVPTVSSCGGFAGIVDTTGVLWSASRAQNQLMRYVTGMGGNPTCLPGGSLPGDVAEDNAGNIWVSASSNLRVYSPTGALLNTFPIPGAQGLLGIDVSPSDGHIWVADFDTDHLFRVSPAGTVIASIPTHQTPNGVSVDATGKVWVANLEDDDVQRIDPATNAVDLTVSLGAGALPYSPSEMAGSVHFTATVPFGTWTVVFDGGAADVNWDSVSWTSQESSGSSIAVFARSANSPADLSGMAFVQVTNGGNPPLVGRYIQVQARFSKAPMGNTSPILYDLTIEGTQQTTPPPPDCVQYNRRNPGSLLLYPEFDNRGGVVSLLTVTNVDCDGEDVDVEFVYIDKNDCQEFNRTERLTPCDTLTLITNAHDPNDERGYVYAFAKHPVTGQAIVHNALAGQLLIVDGLASFEYSVNPVLFKGIGNGTITDLDGDGIRDLDGVEYDMAPDQILVPRFLGQAPPRPQAGGGGAQSQLVLIGLTGGRAFTTRVDFLIYNDNEEAFSSEYEFYCWDKPNLLEISGVFANDFLKNWTNDDPAEVIGAPSRESGWMRIDGAVATSPVLSIADPAFYAVLVERIGPYGAADLPFEYCTQDNGDLLPTGLHGDL